MIRRVLVLAPGPPEDLVVELEAALSGLPYELVVPEGDGEGNLRDLLPTADVVVGDWSGRFPMGAPEAALAERASLLQQPGVGVDLIDLDAWASHGVAVANTAGANASSVAEWCVASAILLLRSAAWSDAMVRRGEWPQRAVVERGCRDLSDVQVGVIGLGAIGGATVERLMAFGGRVAYWNRTPKPGAPAGAVSLGLAELMSTSDVLVLTVAETDDTRRLLDAAAIATMPPGAVVVNAGRGGLVDEIALVSALESGRLAGAALDVFATEPLPADSRLRELDSVMLSPHVAGGTATARRRMFAMTAANVAAALAGRDLRSVVNRADRIIRQSVKKEQT